MNIGIVVGSLRKDSFNKKIAHALMEVADTSLHVRVIDISSLPLFNQDLEETPPPSWVQFRKEIASLDGFLLVTPEYNRSIPAVLKNALDVGSRPYGKSVWNGLPCAIVSSSIGSTGAFGANHHLRQSLVFLNTPTMQQPEAYLARVDTLFNEEGKLVQAETREFLSNFMQSYQSWVQGFM